MRPEEPETLRGVPGGVGSSTHELAPLPGGMCPTQTESQVGASSCACACAYPGAYDAAFPGEGVAWVIEKFSKEGAKATFPEQPPV